MKNIVSGIGDMCFQGNIVDSCWYQNLRYDNGKVNLSAITILSEIIYWYKPIEVRAETNGEIIKYKKKFKADKLQRSYQSFADQFGLTKGQAKLACKFLKDRGLINIEFRNIITESGQSIANVMFIEPVLEEIKRVSTKKDFVEDGNCNKPTKGKSKQVSRSIIPTKGVNPKVCKSIDIPDESTNEQVGNSNPTLTENVLTDVCKTSDTSMEPHQETYTENTTEITTEKKRNIYRSTAEKVIDYLNEKVGTNYRYTVKETRALINTRLNQGFNIEDFIKVINIKTEEWLGTEYEKYLRPQTLFGKSFESYLNQKPKSNRVIKTYNEYNPSDTFSNRRQRKYDIAKIERQLLGWE